MGKFKNGHPGGPGRPRGSRNAVNLMLDKLAEADAETMVKAMVDAATSGDRVAARLVLNRIWSAPKGRAANVDLPAIKTPADLLAAHAAIASAITGGTITPQEGVGLSSMLETHRRAFELVAQEKRVEEMEAELRGYRKQLA
jgi:hypothetical protein